MNLRIENGYLKWAAVPGATGYQIVEWPIGGPMDTRIYRSVPASTLAVPAKPGYRYGGRAFTTSAWATEVECPPLSPVRYAVGVHTGAREFDYTAARVLGARLVRVGGLSATMSRDDLAKIVGRYQALGARVIALVDFNGAAPSVQDCANLGTWALIPGLEAIEFGNEPWQQNEAWDYAQYARSYKAAQIAVRAVNPKVPVLACADSARRSHRPGFEVLKALKALGCIPDGVQFHPYGPAYLTSRLWELNRDLAEVGWPHIPKWATEVGIATDGGLLLSDNYGWPVDLSYGAAANLLDQIVRNLLGAGAVHRVVMYMGTDYRAHGETSQREHYFGLTTYANGEKGGLTAAARSLLKTEAPR